MKKHARLHVAVGVIVNASHQVLIARRANHLHQGGLWEFPGGKVESGELAEQAVKRELYEELNVVVECCSALLQITHDYSDKNVLLDVWLVSQFSGKPQGLQGQPLQWVSIDNLVSYDFPAANEPIITALQKRLLDIGA